MDFNIQGTTVDSVVLKALLVSHGIRVSKEIYRKFSESFRLSTDPLRCNTIILPDFTVVQLTDLAFHMEYIKKAISWSAIKQLRYLNQMRTPFALDVDETGKPTVFYNREKITEVYFSRQTDFYHQRTSSGTPFLGNAVLQGTQWLSFHLLWKCDYACAGEPCQYCYSGGELHNLVKRKRNLPTYPTPDEIAEMVEYAIIKEKCADSIQITGGSTFNVQAECDKIKTILEAINNRIGRENIEGEVLVYTTPPGDPHLLDQLFEAGADRVAMSLEIWNAELAAKIMPGKMKYTGRERHFEALEYVACKYGKNKACCNFIIGLEPAESTLEGAEYMASRGIVPVASVWVPFGRPVLGSMKTPGIDYYKKVADGLAGIYSEYSIVPPGAKGLNVCMCRDIFLKL